MIGIVEIGQSEAAVLKNYSPMEIAALAQIFIDAKNQIQPTPYVITIGSTPDDHEKCCGSFNNEERKAFRPINYTSLSEPNKLEVDKHLGIQ